MKRDYKLYLNDIKESINLIEEYIKGVTEEQFIGDIRTQDKVIRRLEIIGETSSNIPRALKEKNKNVLWLEMINFRNFVIHNYFEASLKRIWNIIKRDLPKIKQEIQHIKLV